MKAKKTDKRKIPRNHYLCTWKASQNKLTRINFTKRSKAGKTKHHVIPHCLDATHIIWYIIAIQYRNYKKQKITPSGYLMIGWPKCLGDYQSKRIEEWLDSVRKSKRKLDRWIISKLPCHLSGSKRKLRKLDWICKSKAA